MRPALDLIVRVIDAGAADVPLAQSDVRLLATCLSRLVAGASIEVAFDIAPGWRGRVAEHLKKTAAVSPDLSARRMHAVLAHYAATSYEADRQSAARPTAEREALYRLILAHKGRVPSVRTIQRLRAERAKHLPANGAVNGAPLCPRTNQPGREP